MLISGARLIGKTSLISFSFSDSSFMLFIPLILIKENFSPAPLLLPRLAYLFVAGQQDHTDFSVLFLSLVLYNEFCLEKDILQFGLYSGAKSVRGLKRSSEKDSMDGWQQSL